MNAQNDNANRPRNGEPLVEGGRFAYYVRQLLHTASTGDDRARRRFVQTQAPLIGGYAVYLLNLTDESLEEAFTDSLSALEGSVPQTLMGYRLAFPARSPQHRVDAWRTWRRVADRHLADRRPAGTDSSSRRRHRVPILR